MAQPTTSRRLALLCLGVIAAGRTRAAPSQLSKVSVKYVSVKYVDIGTTPGKDCIECSQYLPGKVITGPGSCKIVEGEISPRGHCIAFSPKPTS
jgi:hypothetical protein